MNIQLDPVVLIATLSVLAWAVTLIVGIHIGRKVERSTWVSAATPGIQKPVIYLKDQGYVVMISEEFDMLNLVEVREGTATH